MMKNLLQLLILYKQIIALLLIELLVLLGITGGGESEISNYNTHS